MDQLAAITVDVVAAAGSEHIEQLPSGSYRVSVYAGADPLTGRELRFRETAKTMPEAQILLGRLPEQADAGRRPESRVLVSELLARYLEVAELDSSTRHTYEGYLRRTILPALGSVELRKVRGPMLDTLYARLREPPRHRRGLEPAHLLHPADVQLQMDPASSQRIQAAVCAPRQEAPQVRVGMITRGTGVPGQIGSNRQPQPVGSSR
jgi:hypothetical protein